MFEWKIEFRVLATMVRSLRKLDLDLDKVFACWTCPADKSDCRNCMVHSDEIWDKLAVLLSAGA